MCLNTTTTYTECTDTLRNMKQCTTYKQMVADAEKHYRRRYPWIHESDDEDYAAHIPPTKCPMYYEEKDEEKGCCVFCESRKPKPNKGVKMTPYLDEMEAKMNAKMLAQEKEKKLEGSPGQSV